MILTEIRSSVRVNPEFVLSLVYVPSRKCIYLILARERKEIKKRLIVIPASSKGGLAPGQLADR
ncbi:MAG: hypothetical protein NUV98_01710, partial [Candidatus Roizmanbacteria bacterium]|nr:hypothetical protein [Candidatus Roizmanbacteria bacterium]